MRRKSSPPSENSGANHDAKSRSIAPRRPGANDGTDITLPSPPADPITDIALRLAELQKVRMFCITSQSRCDRSIESALARCLGFSIDATEAERKAVYKAAADIRIAVEKGKPYKSLPSDDPRALGLSDFIPLIPISAQARAVWDQKRDQVELMMRALAETLPAMAFVREHAKGCGELGLARIVGEAPLIRVYATHERLWKRMGVAVIGGERQQKKTDTDEALLHGYRPSRRAELWSVCSDTMLRAQWRKGDEDGEGYPIGPYGEVYRQRKAATAQRIIDTEALPFSDRAKWTKARADKDARRVMSKAFLQDLWRIFHDKEPIYPARWAEAQRARRAA
jgi:hypothetical protein